MASDGNPFDRALHGALRIAYRLQLAWWRVRRPKLLGAAVAVWHDGRILVIRNSYRERLGLPAGSVRRRESIRAAASRELREEVGIAVDAMGLEYVGEFTEINGYAVDCVHIFELHCDAPPRVCVDGREVVWAEFLAPSAAAAQVNFLVRTYLHGRAKSLSD